MKNYQAKDVLPFTYVVGPISLAASASGSSNLTMEANSWFEHHYWMASTDQDSVISGTLAAVAPNLFTCQITDQSSGRQLTSNKVPQRSLFGPANGGNLRMIRPVVFPPNAILQFDLTSLYAGGTLAVTISLIGYKVFNPGAV